MSTSTNEMASGPERCLEPSRAADWLRRGGLVAFPTETVYGLGVDATSTAAVDRLFAVKGRPSNNPLIVHIAQLEQLSDVGRDIPEAAMLLLEHFAPGPITVVIPKQPSIVPRVTAGLDSVGVRIPADPLARSMLKAVWRPIAAPSANRSGRPSCTKAESVLEEFGSDIDAILIGQPSTLGIESTVVDCTSPRPRLLRPGAVSLEQLVDLLPSLIVAAREATAGENSPGRLHPHYQPAARVVLIDDPSEALADHDAAYHGTTAHPDGVRFGWHVCHASVEHYARAFYESLREVDRRGLSLIYCQRVPARGTGTALLDRLERAAEPRR